MNKNKIRSRFFRYERRELPLLSRAAFFHRVAAHTLVALGLIVFSLSIGVVCYHFLVELSWVDALLNASMILGGMGPVDRVTTTSGKIFASIYALYSGLMLLAAMGILFAPVFHRLLHQFHLPDPGEKT